MNRCKLLSTVIIPMVMLIAVPFLMAQNVPPELGSSIKGLRDAKAYCERILREVEEGTTILVPFEVKTADGKTMLLDDYNLLPKERRPKVLETLHTPVEVKDIAARLSAAKLSGDDQKRAIAGMVAESKSASGAWKDRLAKIEQKLGLQPTQTGGAGGKQVLLHGEVVEVTGDTVRVSVKGKVDPQVGEAVKITYEIEGTGIKADVAKGKIAKVEPGFATVDISNKTAEIRKGYLAEIMSSAGGETAKPPQPNGDLDLTGEWTNDAPKVEPLFHAAVKTFRLEKTPQGTFVVPGSNSNANVRFLKDEPVFLSHSGSRLATGKVERDPKTGAIVRIQWSAGSTWTRGVQSGASDADLSGEWIIRASKDTRFGTEFTNPKSFRLKKTPAGAFVNPGSSNARIVIIKGELHFFNNAGNKTAFAGESKTGSINRIDWSDGSVFIRINASGGGNDSADDISGRWNFIDKAVLILKRRPDGRYDVQYEKTDGLDGIGAFTGENTFRIDWKSATREGVYMWTLDASRTQADVSVTFYGDTPFKAWVKRLDGSGVQPKTKIDPGVSPMAALDLSGRWEEAGPFGKAIWYLKRRSAGGYAAEQKGLSNANGVAALNGDRLRIDWKSGDGEFEGFTEVTLNEKRDAGKGRSVLKKDGDATLPAVFKRLEAAAGSAGKLDLSGRWYEPRTTDWIVKRRSDQEYEVIDVKKVYPDVIATIDPSSGDILKGDWKTNSGSGRFELEINSADRIKVIGKLTIWFNGKAVATRMVERTELSTNVPEIKKKDFDTPAEKKEELKKDFDTPAEKKEELKKADKNKDDKEKADKKNHLATTPIVLKFGNGETSYAAVLTRGDAKFPEDGLELSGKRYKLFLCPLQAGKTYQIHMESKNFRSHLILRDPAGFFHDRDNTRIVFKVKHTATYEIITTHLEKGFETPTSSEGAFTLSVREVNSVPGVEIIR